MKALTMRPKTARSYRSVLGQIRTEVLPDERWEDVAARELRRLTLEIQIYQLQLEGRPGRRQLGQAARKLAEAQELIRLRAAGGLPVKQHELNFGP